ncbi:uncharacterized protein TNIN_419171 [Trichonephila inaurata madagascariensis]|uniref:Uncharacterized protein n=1 Tax=Trichonephila inaurata madagascariensis TaxID=2747483 RepID=A0A8X6YTL1_9ARAC|nr:uncharacterized protein TNIN_419171 [Trichonephila inaurata madagascariensis]
MEVLEKVWIWILLCVIVALRLDATDSLPECTRDGNNSKVEWRMEKQTTQLYLNSSTAHSFRKRNLKVEMEVLEKVWIWILLCVIVALRLDATDSLPECTRDGNNSKVEWRMEKQTTQLYLNSSTGIDNGGWNISSSLGEWKVVHSVNAHSSIKTMTRGSSNNSA